VLAFSVIAYLVISLAIGLWAARRVRNENDFVSAGRNLPLMLATTTVFGTWFGSETVLGASSEFAETGMKGVIEDPFGASLCLVLVAAFFARPLYRLNLLTFGDFYKVTFGRRAEFVSAIFLILSYLGWVAAQMVACGIIIHAVMPAVSVEAGIVASALVVFGCTATGGLWSVSITDFFHVIIIIIGLIACVVVLVPQAGGFSNIVDAQPDGFFAFHPDRSLNGWLVHFAAWITIGLGSIPQQDVYQRVMASKTEKIAVRSSYFGALMYLTIAFIPLLLTLCAKVLVVTPSGDSQMLLPDLIMQHTGVWIQILFFGALLSAVLNAACGALLAPSVILSENLILPRLKQDLSQKARLRLMRWSVIIVGCVSLGMALVRQDIYELVGEASVISLVGLFVPLCAGLFLKNRNEIAAITSMIGGSAVWFIFRWNETEESTPPLLWGLAAAFTFYILICVLLPRGNKGHDSLQQGN
jgi:Na+/proline symporter